MTEPLCLDAALGYAQRGWRVLALTPGGKIPVSDKKLQPHGCLSATTDPTHIAELFRLYPLANVGIATGEESGITVIDVDGPHAPALLKQVGKPPKTWTVKTPNGYHLYLTYDKRIKQTARLMEAGDECDCVKKCGIDIRNDRGYVAAPPSVVPQ